MDKLDGKLYELLGDKTLSFGCWFQWKDRDGTISKRQWYSNKFNICLEIQREIHENFEIIGHEPTLTDLHRWMNERYEEDEWVMGPSDITVRVSEEKWNSLYYDSSKSLMEQSDGTKESIASLIESHE